MDHPFEVGKSYQNRNGRYEVVAIQGAKMLVRYDDGREQIVSIHTQARIWENLQLQAAPAAGATGRQSGGGGHKKKAPAASKSDEQEKLITEILEDDRAIFEILTRLTIPPGQIDIYRFFLKNPDDAFSRQQIADAVRESRAESQGGVFMAFGKRISASPDARVRTLRPYNSLFFHHKRSGGKTVLRIRRRVVEIFQSYTKFYAFLMNTERSWLPDEFGSAHWTHNTTVHRLQMGYFGLLERYEEANKKGRAQGG